MLQALKVRGIGGRMSRSLPSYYHAFRASLSETLVFWRLYCVFLPICRAMFTHKSHLLTRVGICFPPALLRSSPFPTLSRSSSNLVRRVIFRANYFLTAQTHPINPKTSEQKGLTLVANLSWGFCKTGTHCQSFIYAQTRYRSVRTRRKTKITRHFRYDAFVIYRRVRRTKQHALIWSFKNVLCVCRSNGAWTRLINFGLLQG